ncbi:putative ubiquitin ligase [Trypanosoma conorhini]|uniref:E3 ubiquitin-protein ligase n=1 Tax=Trypanosoma conorhini TaxID=83891 RepID=A0A3R7P584_9TRYP|nr:putative ubiquitin ligase [Trypanosoma conorhini]RNF12949.1 putative ubiquitin ligase [Trypanosoma conorhini]
MEVVEVSKLLLPMDPASWDTRQVLAYARLHRVEGILEEQVVSKSLRETWDSLVLRDLQNFYAATAAVLQPVSPHDVLEAPPAELLVRRTNPDCAALFREHPERLQAVVEAGLAQMDHDALCACYAAGQLPPLEWWLLMTMDEAARAGLVHQGAPRVCGRALTRHGAIVTCSECAVDRTCVFCAECFQHSPCRNHKHSVRYGSGGGICDCGDPLAWNPASFCSRHRGFQEGDDPAAALQPAQKRWLEVVTRGLLLYQATLLQFVALHANDAALTADRDAALRWFDRALRRTMALSLHLANVGEGSRRLMCLALMEKTPLPRPIAGQVGGSGAAQSVRVSCVEEFFIANIFTLGWRGFIIWESSLVCLMAMCVSDPVLRIPIAELLLKYGERLSVMERQHVEELVVQVLSVKDVVDCLLWRTPHPPWECVIGNETILHRTLSALLYVCSHVHRSPELLPGATEVVYQACHWLELVLGASENAKVLVASRQLFRAWCKALCLIGLSSKVARETRDTGSADYNIDKDHAMKMEMGLRCTFNLLRHMVFGVGAALLSGEAPFPAPQPQPSFPLAWEPSPDAALSHRYHRQVLDALALPPASPLLLAASGAGAEAEGPCRAYMRELFMESLRLINAALAEKRGAFTPATYVLTGRDAEHMLPRYDLLDGKSPNPTSFVIPHLRFFAVLVQVWTGLLQQQEQLRRRQDACLAGGACPSAGEPFSALVSEVFAASQSRADYWIDECLMPFVLVGQVERGLWPRDECDVTLRTRYYLSDSAPDITTDMYLLHLLMLLTPSEALATQMLQRHAVTRADEPAWSWYPQFLRLILTLCLTEWGAVIRDEADLRRALQREVVHCVVLFRNVSFHAVEGAARRFKRMLPGLNPVTLLPSILGEVAVPEQRGQMQFFVLKDAATWRANVSLYHPLVRDNALPELQELYERLVRRENMARAREGKEGPTASSAAAAPRAVFPLPSLPWLKATRQAQSGDANAASEAVLRRQLCLLLQTPAVLSVAIATVHMYLAPEQREKGRARGAALSERQLLHAMSLLHIAMQACRVISSGDGGAPSSLCAQGSTPAVDWDAVKMFQQQFMPPSGYARDALRQLLPVKGILDAATLKEKLEMEVAPHGARGLASEEPPNGRTTISALRQIYAKFNESGRDVYGIAAMAAHILQGVGEFSPLFSAEEAAAEQQARAEQDEQRRLRLKERQAMLLRRVKSSDARSSASIVAALDQGAPSGAAAATATGAAASSGGTVADFLREARAVASSSSAASSTSVMATVLLRLAQAECCMCRSLSTEPLMLLASTFTADTLYRLRFDASERDAPMALKLNGQIHLCGHAAHKSCVARVLRRIQLFTGGNSTVVFPSTFGVKSFNCPLCFMVCTALCPMPTLAASAAGRASSASPSSLFEDVRGDTLKTTKEASTLHRLLARAAVGEPLSSSSGGSALASPSRLQQLDPGAWALAETLRTARNQMCVALEWVKAGGEVQYNELLTLLSLLVSIDAKLLAANAAKLTSEFQRKGDALCLLLMQLLYCPTTAAASLAQYTKLLLVSSAHDVFVCPPAGEEGAEAYNKLLIAVWRELGCLTLLKLFILDLSPAEVVQCDGDKVTLTTLKPDALATLEGRRRAVLTMLRYLLQLPFATEQEGELCTALSALVQQVLADGVSEPQTAWLGGMPTPQLVQCTPLPVTYDGPPLWRQFITCRVFHLTPTFVDLILSMSSTQPCSVCGDSEAQRVWCSLCGRSLCLGPSLTPPELYDHARDCGNGVGIYLHPESNVFLVLLTVEERLLHHRGLYADEYGQAGVNDFHGRNVPLDDAAVKAWLSLWIRSRWGVQSTVVKKLSLGELKKL